MTRDEHLAWCKQRANEYVDRGDLVNAVASMMRDLEEHPETKITGSSYFLLAAGTQAVVNGDAQAVRRFIEGFK